MDADLGGGVCGHPSACGHKDQDAECGDKEQEAEGGEEGGGAHHRRRTAQEDHCGRQYLDPRRWATGDSPAAERQ